MTPNPQPPRQEWIKEGLKAARMRDGLAQVLSDRQRRSGENYTAAAAPLSVELLRDAKPPYRPCALPKERDPESK